MDESIWQPTLQLCLFGPAHGKGYLSVYCQAYLTEGGFAPSKMCDCDGVMLCWPPRTQVLLHSHVVSSGCGPREFKAALISPVPRLTCSACFPHQALHSGLARTSSAVLVPLTTACQCENQASQANCVESVVKAARQLLDGEALADIVHLHAAVFSTLSGSPLLQGSSSSSSSLQHQQHLQPHATQHSFAMSYELGAELLRSIGMKAPSGESSGGAGGAGFGDGSTGGGKGASAALLFEGAAVDEQTLNGHLFSEVRRAQAYALCRTCVWLSIGLQTNNIVMCVIGTSFLSWREVRQLPCRPAMRQALTFCTAMGLTGNERSRTSSVPLHPAMLQACGPQYVSLNFCRLCCKHADPKCLPLNVCRLCCEHAALSKAAAATSADAAAAAFGRSKRKQTGRKGVRGSAAEEAEEDGDLSRLGIDIQAPCVEEIVLLQDEAVFIHAPVSSAHSGKQQGTPPCLQQDALCRPMW
eukprot:scaffold46102_cov19-Tisochrysis_lutea.AAC.1